MPKNFIGDNSQFHIQAGHMMYLLFDLIKIVNGMINWYDTLTKLMRGYRTQRKDGRCKYSFTKIQLHSPTFFSW
jgi:hypothetical protein